MKKRGYPMGIGHILLLVFMACLLLSMFALLLYSRSLHSQGSYLEFYEGILLQVDDRERLLYVVSDVDESDGESKARSFSYDQERVDVGELKGMVGSEIRVGHFPESDFAMVIESEFPEDSIL